MEHITGGTIWLLVRRVSELPGLGCYELMQLAGPQYPTGILVLPDHFDQSVLLNNEHYMRIANSVQQTANALLERVVVANAHLFKVPAFRQSIPVAVVVPNNAVWSRLTLNPVLLEFEWHETTLQKMNNFYREMLTKQAEERTAKEQLQKRIAETRARYDEFVRKTDMQARPGIGELVANPFIYEGKSIGIIGRFATMLTKDRAIID